MSGGCESLGLSAAKSSELLVATLGQAPIGSWPRSSVLPTDRDHIDEATFAENSQQIPNSVGGLAKKRGDLLVCERAVPLEQLKDGPLHASSESSAREASDQTARELASAAQPTDRTRKGFGLR